MDVRALHSPAISCVWRLSDPAAIFTSLRNDLPAFAATAAEAALQMLLCVAHSITQGGPE